MDFTKPGFGWTTSKANKVELIKGYSLIDLQSIVKTTSNLLESSYPIEFLRSFLDSNDRKNIQLPSSQNFTSCMKEVMDNYFTHNNDNLQNQQYEMLKATNTSSGRHLRWDIMIIEPNASFRLHAHPNIEVIFVIQGTIHEYRLIGKPPKTEFSVDDNVGPNLSNDPTVNFQHRSVKAFSQIDDIKSAFLLNEIGSVHLSFTKEDVS